MEDLKFEKIYSDFEKPVYNFVLRMARNDLLAQDLTQDIFVKIYQNLATFRGEAKLSTWIYQIANNTYLDYLRTSSFKKQNKTDILEDEEDLHVEEIDKVLSIDEQLVKAEENDCVHEYVNNLPEDYRAVMVLHDLQGLKNREIAEVLDCSLDTIKIRLHRARKKFRTVCANDCNLYRNSNNEICCEKKEVNLK
jgi:RNA polymerase sigma-70 factor (ECF subfamily)